MATPIKRKLTSVNAPTMKRTASTSAVKRSPAAPSEEAPKTRKPRTQKDLTPADKEFNKKRAEVLENRRGEGQQKAGRKTAKERFQERLAKWNEQVKDFNTIAKLQRTCQADNVKTAAANRKKVIQHAKETLEAKLAHRKNLLAKTKPEFKDNKIVQYRPTKEDREVKVKAKPVLAPMHRVDRKEKKIVEVVRKPRKPKGPVDQDLSKAQKGSRKAHTVAV